MIQARTPNTMEWSTPLPLDTERADMREQWLRRLLSMDQTDLGDRCAVLMISVRRGTQITIGGKGCKRLLLDHGLGKSL